MRLKLPAWVWVMAGGPLIGAGGVGMLVFANGPGLLGSALAVGTGVVCFVTAARLKSGAPSLELPPSHPAHPSQRLESPGSRAGPRAALEVPATVLLGGSLPVRARLFLPTRGDLDPHQQHLRFVIEERTTAEDAPGDSPSNEPVHHEETFFVKAPGDTVGEWEATWTPRVPPGAPPSFVGRGFCL